jgi:hypothetical protein
MWSKLSKFVFLYISPTLSCSMIFLNLCLYVKKQIKNDYTLFFFFFFFCNNNQQKKCTFYVFQFYIAYIEQVLNENFTNSNLGQFYIIECCFKIKFIFYP